MNYHDDADTDSILFEDCAQVMAEWGMGDSAKGGGCSWPGYLDE